MKFDEFKSARQLLTNPNNPNAQYDGYAFSGEGVDRDVLNAMPQQFVYSMVGDSEIVPGLVDGAVAYFVAKNIAPSENNSDNTSITEANDPVDSEYTEEFAESPVDEVIPGPSAKAGLRAGAPRGILGLFRQ